MKFTIKEKYAVLKIEEKPTVDLYHLINLDTGDKVTTLGFKSGEQLKSLDVIEVTLNLDVKTKRIETKDGGFKYLPVANTFISTLKKVKAQ